MPNATLRVQCPTCTMPIGLRPEADPGERPDYFLGGGSGPEVLEYCLDYTEPECLCYEAVVEQGDEAIISFYEQKLFDAADNAELEIDEDDYDYGYEERDDFYYFDLPFGD